MYPVGLIRFLITMTPPTPLLRPARVLAALTSLLMNGALLHADVSLPAIFGSGMVLQRDQPLPIWGRAESGETVNIAFAGHHAQTKAGEDGRWRVVLPATPAGGPHTLAVHGRNKLRFDDVLVGDVWLCSGQSNMNFRLSQTDNAERDVAAARHPRMRLFTVTRAVAAEPAADVEGRWDACAPETAGKFSAVAYFFGRQWQQDTGVPVGLIHSSWGGTAAEAWTPRDVLAGDLKLRVTLERWARELAEFPKKKADFEANRERLVAEWKVAVDTAKAAGRMPPSEPRLRTGPGTQYEPSGLFNAMIAPLAPFALCGVTWYQGEANARRAREYQTLFPALIRSWRAAWDREDLPFVYVQLPNLAREPEPSRSGWAELREAQLLTLRVPHTAMAVTIDVGDPADLHPKNKRPVGERLAYAAEALLGQRPLGEGLSPVYREATFSGNEARIQFSPTGGSLRPRDGRKVTGFTIAGEDRAFAPAEVKLDGGTVVVSSPLVPAPVAVRYAWADNPDANLVNAAGLPAAPFRTDNWPTPADGTGSN